MSNRELLADHTTSCPLARLYSTGQITQQQYNAGVKFSEVYHKYLESIGAPYPFPQAQDGERSDTGMPDITLSDSECRRRKLAFQEAFDKVEAKGARVRMSVTNIAVYESKPVDDWDLECLKIGLSALL